MKIFVLCSIAFTSAATVFAQAPVAPPHTMTLTGCITGGTKARPISLVNALALPVGTEATPPEPTPPPPPNVNTPTAGSVGTTGIVRGSAPAGSSASSVGGYRLSGTDMTPWIGRRVQLVGILVSSPAGSSGIPISISGTTKTDPLPMPEFRVVSVQPITGACSLK